MSIPPAEVTSRTIRIERWRAVLAGIYESAPSIFILLIVVRWFQGGPFEKSLIPAANPIGFLIAPLAIFLDRRFRSGPSRALSALYGGAALALLLASVVPVEGYFIALCVLAMVMHASGTTFVTSLYSANIPATIRGRSFAQFNLIRIATSIVFASGAGWMLSGRLHLYPVLMAVFALALAGSAWLVKLLPKVVVQYEQRSLLGCFAYLKTDRLLLDTSVAWMLLGFGNLMMVPLRVEYLANQRYGLNLSEAQIAILISTLPNLARLIGTPIWGRIFDTVNFFSLRMILNISFLVGTLAFFASGSMWVLMLSAVLIGFTTAGGDIAWSLWVTKFAPPERVSDYMAVHTFFTGIRGLIAPAVGFYMLEFVSMRALSWFSALLMALSVFVLWRTQRREAR